MLRLWLDFPLAAVDVGYDLRPPVLDHCTIVFDESRNRRIARLRQSCQGVANRHPRLMFADSIAFDLDKDGARPRRYAAVARLVRRIVEIDERPIGRLLAMAGGK